MVKAKVKDYDKYIEGIENFSQEYIEKLLLFLEAIYDNEYQVLYATRHQMHITEEMWDNYEVLGISNLPEQQMMLRVGREVNQAFRIFRKNTRKRYVTKNPKKQADQQETTTGDTVKQSD